MPRLLPRRLCKLHGIDPERYLAEARYFCDGPGLTRSSFFRLDDRSGPLVAHVEAGRWSVREDGELMAGVGGLLIRASTRMLVVGAGATGSENPSFHPDEGTLKTP